MFSRWRSNDPVTPSPRRRSRLPFRLRHPAQLLVVAFALVIFVGTIFLWLPAARAGPTSAPFLTALFTATSAVCVTGLTVVDTPTYWTGFGQVVIMILIQIGGFGIMTLTSLLVLVVYRNLGVLGRLLAQTETKTVGLGEVKRVLLGVAAFSLLFEVVTALSITVRIWTTYEESFGRSAYLGLFHAVSAFNNAGFSLYEDSLVRFVSDWWVTSAVMLAVVAGALGFPVLLELRRELFKPSAWSLHTKLTVGMSALLAVVGTVVVLVAEWANPATLGQLPTADKFLAGIFQSAGSRTAGFETISHAAMHETTWLWTMIMMFIGGGSAGAAGGVKVTTVAILGAMVWAEARGDPTVDLMGRRIPGTAQRQALAVVFAGFATVLLGVFLLMAENDFGLSRTLFEAFSAFGTTGLSTGVTSDLSTSSRVAVVVLMFAGRLGPITLAAALALRERRRQYRLPEERPIVG